MNFKIFDKFELKIIVVTTAICILGLVSIYSASVAYQFENSFFLKQIIWVLIGFGGMVFFSYLNYHLLIRWSWLLYLIVIFFLIFILVNASSGGVVDRWVIIGPISIQPSEFSKLTVVFLLAYYYKDHRKIANSKISNLLPPILIVMLPFVLILIQPDLGTASILLITAVVVIIFSGINYKWIVGSLILLIFSIPALWIYVLKPYQKERILILLDPQRDPLGTGYHIIQSKIAIGSGLFFGKGFLGGKQTQLNFLPARHTDFVFAVFSEEWGFLGSILVVLCFVFLIFLLLKEINTFNSRCGIILAMGIVVIIASQSLINMGMVMGLLPVVGLPLPLMSYGGSSVVTIMISIGILLNIRKKEKNY